MKSILDKFLQIEDHSKQMEFLSNLKEKDLQYFCYDYFDLQYMTKLYNENNTYEFLKNKINELRKENENLMKEIAELKEKVKEREKETNND